MATAIMGRCVTSRDAWHLSKERERVTAPVFLWQHVEVHPSGVDALSASHRRLGTSQRQIRGNMIMATPETHHIAVFCDFENVAIGLKEGNYPDFKIRPVLERMLLKGSIVVKKAYCDWDRYKEYKRDMHEAAFGIVTRNTSATCTRRHSS
jgi:hypothetical protein